MVTRQCRGQVAHIVAPVGVVKAEALGGFRGVPRVVDVCNREERGRGEERGKEQKGAAAEGKE